MDYAAASACMGHASKVSGSHAAEAKTAAQSAMQTLRQVTAEALSTAAYQSGVGVEPSYPGRPSYPVASAAAGAPHATAAGPARQRSSTSPSVLHISHGPDGGSASEHAGASTFGSAANSPKAPGGTATATDSSQALRSDAMSHRRLHSASVQRVIHGPPTSSPGLLEASHAAVGRSVAGQPPAAADTRARERFGARAKSALPHAGYASSAAGSAASAPARTMLDVNVAAHAGTMHSSAVPHSKGRMPIQMSIGGLDFHAPPKERRSVFATTPSKSTIAQPGHDAMDTP